MRRLREHLPGLGILVLLSLWLTRHFMFSSAFPAGTDMLGFVSRAQENANWHQVFSVWSPSSFGAPRQYTLDNVLGFLTLLTGDPLVTVKLLVLGTLFASGGFAYLLAWRWYQNRQIALLAGLLYMTSQAAISRWGSGQLNIEIAIAVAPLLIYLWAECIEHYTLRLALAFSLTASALMLVRLDMVLYFLPFLALFVLVRAAAARGTDSWRNLFASARVIAPAMLALNLYQLIPLLGGVRASWVSSGRLFDINNLVDRSLGAYDSVLGFGREIGYLGFTGQQTWFSHPWVGLWIYFASASIIVALAYSAVWRRVDSRTLFLLAAALLATFLAKGVRDPMGGPYLWAVDHIPAFGNLRGPNRWLIVQALAYSVLAGIVGQYVFHQLNARRQLATDTRRALVAAAAAGLVALMLLPVAPTLLSGFRTWRPDRGQVSLMSRIARDRDDFRVASVPYDQVARFLDQGSYHGYEHDLGGESALWTNHPVVGDGSWNRRASDFVAFTSSLLRNRDPAFQALLGTLGVKYLLKFNYPPTSPHLLDPARPIYQQQAIAKMSGLERVERTDRGDLYALSSRSPAVSFRPNLALILGGSAGLAALADTPGIDLRNWAAVTADDALDRGGISELLKVASKANLILISDERLEDLAVLATKPVARTAAITSDSELDRRTQLLPSDSSVRSGSMADKSAAPPKAGSSSSTGSFTVRGIPRQLELWARVKAGPTAGRIAFTIDGNQVGEVTPLAVESRGFRWARINSMKVAPGLHHLEARGSRSAFGRAFDVDDTKLVDPLALNANLVKLQAGLAPARARIAYSLDVDDIQKWGASPDYFGGEATLGGSGAEFWQVSEPATIRATRTAGSVGVSLDKQRKLFTFVRHNFSAPQDWRNRPYISLKYRGTDSKNTYLFIVDFDSNRRNSAVYAFVDASGGWRTQALSLRTPTRTTGRMDWSHVTSVRIASNSKAAGKDVLELGGLRLSNAQTEIPLRYPVIAGDQRRTVSLTSPGHDFKRRFGHISASSTQLDTKLPLSALGKGLRLIVPPPQPSYERPAPVVRFEKKSPTRYDFSFTSNYPGVLMLDQGHHPKWRVRSQSGTEPLPVFSVANGFFFEAGTHSGSIRFTGQRFAPLGVVLSLLSALVMLALVYTRRREAIAARQPEFLVVGAKAELPPSLNAGRLLKVAVGSLIILALSPVAGIACLVVATVLLRPTWWMAWLCAMALVVLAPVVTALHIDASLDELGFGALVFMTISLVLLIAEVRGSRASISTTSAQPSDARAESGDSDTDGGTPTGSPLPPASPEPAGDRSGVLVR